MSYYDRPGRYEGRTAVAPRGSLLGSLLRLFGSLLGLLVPLAVLGAGVAALRNVFSDTFVERMAMDKACAEQGFACRAQMTRWERTAIGQTFDMYTPRGTVIIRCQREYYLVGDYGCSRLDLPAVVAAEPPAPAPKPPGPTTARSARSAAAR